MDKRDYCIRFIRSRLHYMSERELDLLMGLTRGLSKNVTSSEVEYTRPVLPETEQRNVDGAYRLMESVRAALTGRNGYPACCITEDGEAPEPGSLVIGERRGELAVIDIAAAMYVYREAGYIRVKRSDMLEGLATAGFILPRNRNPRTATVGGKRCEVVYVPMILLQECSSSKAPTTASKEVTA